ncbi:MAG: UDP-N-acetylmuramate dehydrogenase [Prevotellaceae bacterium]|jgi:UDP-N-acetylmuramate dehydrogenase|nr:UDP-N-acetylmuramate dehydrogenase [Prevotellaceae bacterium]
MQIHRDYPLKAHHTFGFDVKARYYAAPDTPEALHALLADPLYRKLPKLIIGGGSNLLFRADYEGLVIQPRFHAIDIVDEDDDSVTLCADAGVVWDEFVDYCVQHGWGGVENLSGIPGTAGAAPVQNIGAYGVEVKDVIYGVEALRIDSLQPVFFTREACMFGYRDSIFKHTAWKNNIVITRATFKLWKNSQPVTHYGALSAALHDCPTPTLAQVRQAVLAVRRQKLPDPAVAGNAGSFFKNPAVPCAKAHALAAAYPALTLYPANGEEVKVPAAWLIEQCGWKGKRVGQVGVHAPQPLVLVNYGGGTGNDVMQLAADIQQSVAAKFGIALEMEANVVN